MNSGAHNKPIFGWLMPIGVYRWEGELSHSKSRIKDKGFLIYESQTKCFLGTGNFH
jgi:hypothetical protein